MIIRAGFTLNTKRTVYQLEENCIQVHGLSLQMSLESS